MLLLLIIALSYLLKSEVIGVVFNESLLINQHHRNFIDISSVLRKVNDTLDTLQGIGKYVRKNEDLETSNITSPSTLRNGVTKPLFVKEKNALKTSSVITKKPELYPTSSVTTKPYILSKSLVRSIQSTSPIAESKTAELYPTSSVISKPYTLSKTLARNRQSASPTAVSTLVDSSTTAHTSFVSFEITAKGSKSVLRGGDHVQALKWHLVREAVPGPDSAPSGLHMRTVQDYYQLLEQHGEGYLVVFMMELTRLVAEKDVADVRLILRHAESVLTEILKSGKLGWLGYPVTHVILKFGVFVSDGPIALTRKYSTMIYNMIRFRHSSLHGDVNSIIDYADMLYEDAEGRQLFDALQEFEAYPNVTKTSTEVCQGLVDSFFAPYRRLANSESRQTLLDAITYVLKTRFPKRKTNDDGMMMNDKNTKEDHKKTSKDQSASVISASNDIQTGSMGFRSAYNQKDHDETEKTEYSFGYRTKNKVIRSVKDDEQKKTFLEQAKAHLANSKLFRRSENDLKVKQKILKDIVEGSSYSDEEASLQRNLIEALMRTNNDKHHRNVRSTIG